jgi:hypothetical protein
MKLFTTAIVGLLLTTLANAEVICGKQPRLRPVRCVCGRFIDPTGEPLVGVRVKVVKGGTDIMAVTTASDGTFIFTGLEPGTYDLTAEAPGFRTFESAIVLTAPPQKCRRGFVILLDPGFMESCGSRVVKQ